MTLGQTMFSIALGLITLLVTAFAIYVASTTMWGDRWIRRGR